MNDMKFTNNDMVECPKCGTVYNVRRNHHKCPNCGHRDTHYGVMDLIIPFIVIFVVLDILFGISHYVNPVYLLMIINVIIFIKNRNNETFISDYGNSYLETFVHKQYYRLFTAGFIHVDVMHILFNMISLFNIGDVIYQLVGFYYFLAIYFASLVFGNALSSIFHHIKRDDYTVSVGASGAICGLLGFYLFVIFKLSLSPSDFLSYAYSALLPIIITAFNPRVDSLGHLGGLLVGFITGFVIINIIFQAPSYNESEDQVATSEITNETVYEFVFTDKYKNQFDDIYTVKYEDFNEALNEYVTEIENKIITNNNVASIKSDYDEKIEYYEVKNSSNIPYVMNKEEIAIYLRTGKKPYGISLNTNPIVVISKATIKDDNGKTNEVTYIDGVVSN